MIGRSPSTCMFTGDLGTVARFDTAEAAVHYGTAVVRPCHSGGC
jgi:hypothetical protein